MDEENKDKPETEKDREPVEGAKEASQARGEEVPESGSQKEASSSPPEQDTEQKVARLDGLFGFKEGMAFVYSEKGEQIPVTVIKVKPWTVSQIKTKEKDSYTAVQISLLEKTEKNVKSAERGHLKNISKKGALFSREIRGPLPEGIEVGQKVDASSIEKGSKVKITARSKGRGFAGTMKRFNFGGGPGAHGSTFHRQPGSVGNRTWPGRIMPGKKLPGHFGHEKVTLKNVEVVDVQKEEGLVLVKGPVPGPPKALVKILKQRAGGS